MKLIKKLLRIGLAGIFLALGLVYFCHTTIVAETQDFVSDDLQTLPQEKVGLLLGTSKTLKNGRKNLYFYARGVPAEHIHEDFAGFRTLDSVVRAKEIFGQKSFIIISQKFHNERAIFLAQRNGIKAYGYNAQDVHKKAGLKTKIREYFARVKVFYDLYFGVKPKFGGEKIEIK